MEEQTADTDDDPEENTCLQESSKPNPRRKPSSVRPKFVPGK
jgi:hypothetical protein